MYSMLIVAADTAFALALLQRNETAATRAAPVFSCGLVEGARAVACCKRPVDILVERGDWWWSQRPMVSIPVTRRVRARGSARLQACMPASGSREKPRYVASQGPNMGLVER
jgi:hypothetical protein